MQRPSRETGQVRAGDTGPCAPFTDEEVKGQGAAVLGGDLVRERGTLSIARACSKMNFPDFPLIQRVTPTEPKPGGERPETRRRASLSVCRGLAMVAPPPFGTPAEVGTGFT